MRPDDDLDEVRILDEDFAFITWFEKSVVLDAQSQPLVLFHGSDYDFNKFNMDRSRDGAHFFCADYEHAETFGQVKSFFVRIENPLIITQDDLEQEWDKEHPDGYQDDRYLLPRDFVEIFVKKGKQEGRDGVIIRNMDDRDISTDMFLPFSASQIKSATHNVGVFDCDCDDFTDATSPKYLSLYGAPKKKSRSMKP